MRIIICTPYDIGEPRGNSIATARLRDGFADRGHEVFLLHQCERSDQITVEEAGRLFKPDVGLVMHGWRCAGSFHALRSVSPVPLVVSLRGTDLNEMMEDPQSHATLREILDQCDGITVFSKEAMAKLAAEDQLLAKKSRVIPNGTVLPATGVSGGFSWVPPRGGIVFVGVGGIRSVKNTSWLSENLSALRKRGLDIHYVHAGPILEEAEGEKFLRICREKPWIHYTGELPHDQIPALFRLSHVFVSASRSEGMPHSVTEAMLTGVPCLLSDIPGHRVFAPSGREALLFRDREDLLKKASALARDPDLRERLKKRAKERVKKMCRNGNEIEAYLRFFSSLLRGKGDSR